mmetsp:Transcript_29652/g.62358  ORF Transcript_29652/g.62358 Transcript_29652/m.62358 type:complete len:283 (-) Transcript_29652:359-1207(-)
MKVAIVPTAVLAVIGFARADAWIERPDLTARRNASAFRKQAMPKVVSLTPQSDLVNIAPGTLRGGSSLDMPSNQLVTTLVPRIGILTSTLLYFSPMAAVLSASENKSLGELNPIPLAIMAVSSLCWLVYGLSIRDPYVTLSNVPGSIASIYYVTAMLPLVQGKQLKTTQSIILALSAITINLWTWLSLTNKTILEISSALGSFASVLFVVLSVSPLSTIKKVVTTRNSASILTQLTAAQVINTSLWSAYGLAIKDKFVWGPNVTGLGFGLIQLILKILFPSK